MDILIKKPFLILFFIFFTINCYAQNENKFRVDYDLVTFYDPETKTWSKWVEADDTFVININAKGDIAHFKINGTTSIYKKLSSVEEGYIDDNKHYQIIKALDNKGDIFKFQIFDDKYLGLKMMWGDFIIQFAKKR